jgi:hypothetical protein
MTIARIFSIGVVVMFALAVGIATFDAVYAVAPCCAFRNGVYVNLKTGKPAPLPTAHVASPPKTGGSGTPASPSGGSMGHSGGGK